VTVVTPDFLPRLRAALDRRSPATMADERAQRAAVAVVVTAESDPAMLFVKRHERPGDPWSGQAAFPGGFQSAADGSPAATAKRETEEETGLALAVVGEHLGQLDDVYPRSVYLPRVIVTPVVFAVPSRLEVSPGSEVERVTWVHLSDVFDPSNRKPFALLLPGGRREFESVHAGGLVIWGLTERILEQIATVSQ
jgi:8-oxo-dGTP pyrophosphatase MutT (NUDIX family)